MATKNRKKTSKLNDRNKSKIKSSRSSSSLSIKKAFNRSELFKTLAEASNLTKKDVVNLFSGLEEIIAAHFKKQGPQQFTFPALMKIIVKHKPATKARKGTNPFTGEKMMVCRRKAA